MKIFKNKLSKVILIITIISIILSGFFYFGIYRVDHVDLFFIKTEIICNCTYDEFNDWFRDVRFYDYNKSIRLSHCSYIRYDGKVINIYGNYDRSTDVIVINEYGGYGSFSGGGDDIYKKFINDDDIVTITAAYNTSYKAYEINPSGHENNKIVILNKTIQKSNNIINITYNLEKINNYENDEIRFFRITELHDITQLKNVPVRIRCPYSCE